jgi:hypothetical protein
VKAIDAFLISGFERFSHWTQRAAGITCVRLASIVCYLIAALLLCACVLDISQAGSVVWGLVACVAKTIGIERRQDEAFERVANGTANPRKTQWPARAALVLIVLLFSVFVWSVRVSSHLSSLYALRMIALGWSFTPLSEYLEACDPLPPGTSKVRQWFDSMKRSLRPLTQTTGA